MKNTRDENGTNRPNGHRHHLRRYRYLKVEPAAVRTTHLRFLFMGIATFSIGIIFGFNVKDFMIRTCCKTPTVKQVVRFQKTQQEEQVKYVKIERPLPQLNREIQLKKKPELFTRLPDKFLANTPMPPPANFFYIRPWKIMDGLGQDSRSRNSTYFMVFLVKTAAGFARRRFLIRQTWGSLQSIEGKKIAVAFVVGIPTNSAQQILLEKENKLYGDIIQADVSDSYRNLPSKVLAGYQFVSEYMGNISEYFVSTDDDCFINVPNTYTYFTQMDPAKRNAAHCGYIYSARSSRISNMRSKWGVSDEIYPIKAYPRFCHGGMTVYSYEILRDIYRVSLITNYTGFHLEDVLTNGILREKLQRKDSIRPIYLRDPTSKKRMPLMWHLGLRKDRDGAFAGIWYGVRRRFSYYDGPFDPEKGFRAVIKPVVKMEGKSLEETVEYFSPVAMPKKSVIVKVKSSR